MDALRPKSLSERLGAQAVDYIHGRQTYWESDEADARSSLIYTGKRGAQRAIDLEAQKAREFEPEFVQAARDIGISVERIRSIPERAKDPESIRKLSAFGREVDPSVLQMMRETTRALEDAVKPLLKMLEDPQGIAHLVRSTDAPTYDTSVLRGVMEEIQLASERDTQLCGESSDYQVTQALENSPQVWAHYRARLTADPSRRMIYYH